MRLHGDWIEVRGTQTVLALLESAGYQALFVGGCVRNALLDQPVRDIDIATNAKPEQVIALAEGAGLKTVPTGLDHGTVTVISGDIAHEITTFRQDVTTDGRRATIRYSDDLTSDARRRDFTMNALYATRLGELVDPLSGLDDLNARRVRFIEDAAQRIREDFLRILRFFRFHAWYGDPDTGMDADALGAIAANLDGLQSLSRERVGGEMLRLLAAPDPAPAVAAMRHCGVLHALLPGSDDRALAPLVHLEEQISVAPDALRRLAALGGEDLSTALRLSRSAAKKLEVLRHETGSALSPLALGYHHGATQARSVVLLRSAMFDRALEAEDFKAVSQGAEAVFPVHASDLMDRYRGPALGRMLKQLETAWLASGCRLSREALLEQSDG